MFSVLLLWLATGSAPLPPSSQADNANAGTVYFYFTSFTLPRAKNFGIPKISIFCDGRIVAKLRKDSFFGVRLPPGRHTFASKGLRTRLEETAIELEVKPGGVTFVRVEVGIGNLKWWAHLRVVGREEGAFMVSKLNPVSADLIEDAGRATITKPTIREHAAGSTQPPLTNDDILALKRGGLDDEVVLVKIELSRAAFDVSQNGLRPLRQEGVSEGIIAAMVAAVRRTNPADN